jgi:hypothetical protein
MDVTIINGVYELANLARGQVTARITPKTWWANMEQGWVWDLDEFLVNHGRARGLSDRWRHSGERHRQFLVRRHRHRHSVRPMAPPSSSGNSDGAPSSSGNGDGAPSSSGSDQLKICDL